ncbi:MAG: hypothetical protein MRQ09_01850 [Candidatus Midichloria sp.]|nr:hypothetical protein [Candidatus Midichloria sp.]
MELTSNLRPAVYETIVDQAWDPNQYDTGNNNGLSNELNFVQGSALNPEV